MKKMLFVLTLTLVFFLPFAGQSQNSDIKKRVEKINKLVEKNKIDKASENLVKLLDDYPRYGPGWDLLSKIKHYEWQNSKSLDFALGDVKVTVESKDGEDVDEEALKNALDLENLLKQMSPERMAYNEYMETMRKAVQNSKSAYYCSISLRSEIKNMAVDTSLSDEAVAFYREAEKEFSEGNFKKAATKYKRALDHEPNFYKAKLYLGDSYYFMKDYDEAIKYFKRAKAMQPNLIEPRKYLTDAYAKKEEYGKCLEEAIGTFTVYPDYNMLTKLEDAIDLIDKDLTVQWIPRGCLPNQIKKNSFVETEEKLYGDWYFYRKAMKKMEENCDENGIITEENSLTESKYLEVYSWEKMLEQSDANSFKDAKKMQKLGYLDCYVFITCFHPDTYEQYKDFAANNKEKIVKYFDMIIE